MKFMVQYVTYFLMEFEKLNMLKKKYMRPCQKHMEATTKAHLQFQWFLSESEDKIRRLGFCDER